MTQKQEIGWNFDNSYTRLPEIFFKEADPTPVKSPELVILNQSLATSMGLDVEKLQSEKGIKMFSGNEVPEGALPIAQAYAGHQFGNFTMLGDGRAVLLGEHINPSGERLDIQLKGSGRTPFSRRGDGRATLGPMLREYIISESMHALGVPSNRSLAVVTTGESVLRERELPGAVLTRVSDSHLRIGTFEYAAKGGTLEDLRTLADYAINRHYPDIEDDDDKYLMFFKKVIQQQAELIAKWQLVGFIHGVMNTDNMTISGETIDYGPCAFMDVYDPATVFSSIDVQGRYAYQNQPGIGQWNLARFAEALLPLLHDDEEHAVEIAKKELHKFEELYYSHWMAGMRRKLGLLNEEVEDRALVEELLRIMKEHEADFTNTFRALTLGNTSDTEMYGKAEFTQWYKKWQERLERQDEPKSSVQQLMKSANPSVIPRNHRVEEALEAAVDKGDYSVLESLMDVLSDPYAYSPEQEEYAKSPDPSDRPYTTYCGT
ncbi:YdiU family protein [Pontibacillus sp. HMF3514]|uniref:protein adenylyltransferase SelO n=1 Tax=Pontibacillus sp. HMF3514 TaxID=2692425 RepID=UPI001320463C|nr:YdiU family protein [Pontibacillus sp. HMF3514]QHE53992.1 YdiU family protein [Pontibacillus sp. HMF3514]